MYTIYFFKVMVSWLVFKECNYVILFKKILWIFDTELERCIDMPRDRNTNLGSRQLWNPFGLWCGWRGWENLYLV